MSSADAAIVIDSTSCTAQIQTILEKLGIAMNLLA
jgi:hypothetical protein